MLLRNVLQHAATRCNTLQHAATQPRNLLWYLHGPRLLAGDVAEEVAAISCSHATHCNTLQPTATHCNTLQPTATHCDTAAESSRVLKKMPPSHVPTQDTAILQFNALQHTATQ